MTQIINRDVNFRDSVCQKVSSKNKICLISKEELNKIIEPFLELFKKSNLENTLEDLKESVKVVRERNIAKMRILKKQESSGFVLISSLTCAGILAVATSIFLAISHFWIK